MSLLAPLQVHAPFDELEPAALELLAARLEIAYYPRGALIVGPAAGPAARLHVVKQGRVRAEAALGPGECFPVGALIGRRAVTNPYTAETDVFCWELGAEDFERLRELSARFRAFCTDHLAMLLARAQRRLRAEAAESVLDAAGMLAPLKSVLSRAPVQCTRDTPLGEAIARMHASRVGSIVVTDAAGRPEGIFTTVDVLAAAAARAPMDEPIERRMSPDPVALEEEATLADAALAMVRQRIRHVVVTRDGRLAGVVSERDLFALQRVGLRRTAERIEAAPGVEALAAAAADIRSLVRQLLAHGVGAEALTAMASALNDALTRRLIELAAARHRLPGRWCWIALGSEGRLEQTFVTDQDNALIHEDGDAASLLAFADEVNRGLDACGFPLCKGDIMARNPRWCLPAAEWRRLFEGWIRNTDPQALMHAAIFFDFRALAGEARLAGALRAEVLAQTRANRAFCRAMAQAALEARAPLGPIADFSADRLDLKAQGARLFVDAARVLALAAGVADTGTAARLRATGEAAAVEAFHYLQLLRLRAEGNALAVGELNAIDRRLLKEAFKQAARLQQRLRLDFAL